MTNLVNITINGKPHQTAPGTSLLKAAKEVGIDIPVFCFHEKLGPLGCCRICMVEETAKMRKVVPACTVAVMEGMEVQTDSERAKKARKGIIEFTLLNHPLDCPVCDKGGECPLQDHTFAHGATDTRFDHADKKHRDKAYPLSELTVLDRERCILCQRCVRFSSTIEGTCDLVLRNRGASTVIDTFNNEPYNSLFAGNTHEICPTGALTAKKFRFKARSWELTKVPSVCVGCGQGCKVDINVRNGHALRLTLVEDDVVSDGWLCDAGRFGTLEYPENESFLNGCKDRVSAIDLSTIQAADAIKKAWNGKGTGNLSVILSRNVTNEEAYLLTKLAESLNGKIAVSGVQQPILCGNIANMNDLENAETIFLVNADVKNVNPSLYLRLRKLARQGKRIVCIDPIQNETTGIASEFHQIKQADIADSLSSLLPTEGKGVLVYTPERVSTFAREFARLVKRNREMKILPLSTAINALGVKSVVSTIYSVKDILDDVKSGNCDTLILYKKDLTLSMNSKDVLEALEKAKCVIVIDNQGNACAEKAAVFIHSEKYTNYSGSLVNIEGRVQWMNDGNAKAASDGNLGMFELLFTKLGLPWSHKSVQDVTSALLAEVEAFKGISVADIQKGNSFITVTESETKDLPVAKKGLSVAPYTLLVTGEKEGFSRNLNMFVERKPLLLNPADAAKMNIADNDAVEVKMNGSAATCNVSVTNRVLEGEVGLPYFAGESCLQKLVDPKTGIGAIEIVKSVG